MTRWFETKSVEAAMGGSLQQKASASVASLFAAPGAPPLRPVQVAALSGMGNCRGLPYTAMLERLETLIRGEQRIAGHRGDTFHLSALRMAAIAATEPGFAAKWQEWAQ